MNFLTNEFGKAIDEWSPLPVNDVSVSYDKVPVAGETVTFQTGAIGFSQKVSADKAPIMSLVGDKVGSFWRMPKNLRLSNSTRLVEARVTALTETATSADVTITDEDYNLEQLFESPAATAGFVIVMRDPEGNELTGFIGGVAATGTSYVLDIYTTAALTTQSWVGTLSDFTLVAGETQFEIYSNESSIAWTTGTILTTEVNCPKDLSSNPEAVTIFLDGLSNGEYGVDYELGDIYYKKATTGTTDTIAYTSRAGTSSPVTVGDVSITKIGSTTITAAKAALEAEGADTLYDAAGDNTAQVCKASAGVLTKVTVYNPNSTWCFVPLYNTAAGSVTVGTTPPIDFVACPPYGTAYSDFAGSVKYGTAITYSCVATDPAGNTNPAVKLTVSFNYK